MTHRRKYRQNAKTCKKYHMEFVVFIYFGLFVCVDSEKSSVEGVRAWKIYENAGGLASSDS